MLKIKVNIDKVYFTDAITLSESGFADYLPNLEDYENRMARGEIQW
jgi:hypothetical protein